MNLKRNLIKILGIICIVISILILSYKLYQKITRDNYINTELDIFYKQYDNQGNQIRIEKTSYLLVLEIPRINLKEGVYNIDDYRNNISLNVSILPTSILPNEKNSVLLLAAHSGTAANAYFKNLHKLNLGDKINIYYDGLIYQYEINNIYTKDKNDDFYLKKYDKKTLILITCLNDFKYLILEAKNI